MPIKHPTWDDLPERWEDNDRRWSWTWNEGPVEMNVGVQRSTSAPMTLNVGARRTVTSPIVVSIAKRIKPIPTIPPSVILYDQEFNRVGVVTDVPTYTIRKTSNAADSINFSCTLDDNLTEYLEIASNIAVYRGDVKISDGRVISRDMSRNEPSLRAIGHEDRLARGFKTPHNWIAWNNMDLADFARDVLKRFRWQRAASQEDWEGAIEAVDVDLEEEPGSVMLARQPYRSGEQFLESGYIVLRFDLGDKATLHSNDRWARWSERAGDPVRITIQSRSADTPSQLDSMSWDNIPELTAVNVDSENANETRGVLVDDAGRYVDIRVNLYTDDTTTPDNEEEPLFFGRTPILDGLELIWREPGYIEAGKIPLTTGKIVKDGKWDRVNHLKALRDECEEVGWRFRIHHDEEAGKIVLDLAPSLDEWEEGLEVYPFSNDYSRDLVIEQDQNVLVTVQSENDEEYANVLHCWGKGRGIGRPYVRLVDNAAIIARNGEEVEADFELDTSDMDELEQEGLKELERRVNITASYAVELPLNRDWPLLSIEDRVSVVNPKHGRVDTLTISELIMEFSARRDIMRLALGGATLSDRVSALIQSSRRTPRGEIEPPPPAPTNLVAIPVIGGIKLQWTGTGDGWEIWHTTETDDNNDPVNYKLLNVSPRPEYNHAGIESGPVHYYGVRTIVGGRTSTFSYAAGVASRKIGIGDVAGELFDIKPSSIPEPVSGDLSRLWDMDTSTGVTFNAPPIITFRYPVVQASDFVRLHVSASTTMVAQVRDLDSGNWIDVAGTTSSPKSLNAGWNVVQFDNQKMYYGQEYRVILGNAITVNELKFWRIVLADEILAQTLRLVGNMAIESEDGKSRITSTVWEHRGPNDEILFRMEGGDAYFAGDLKAHTVKYDTLDIQFATVTSITGVGGPGSWSIEQAAQDADDWNIIKGQGVLATNERQSIGLFHNDLTTLSGSYTLQMSLDGIGWQDVGSGPYSDLFGFILNENLMRIGHSFIRSKQTVIAFRKESGTATDLWLRFKRHAIAP